MFVDKQKIVITLEDDDIYNLWDILAFAADYDAKNKVLSDRKKLLLSKLLDILKDEYEI